MNAHPLYVEHRELVLLCYGMGLTPEQAARKKELQGLRREAFADALAELCNYHRAEFISGCCDASEIDLDESDYVVKHPYTTKDFNK